MREDQQSSSFRFFNSEFLNESERAKVILSAAMLDEALFAVLNAKFLPNASSTDSLFDGPTAPMGAFSSRIDFAYRLGIISKKLSRDLHIVRRIRNEFAHNVTNCTFNSSSVANRCHILSKSFSQLCEFSEKKSEEPLSVLEQFQIIVGWMLFYLWGLSDRLDAVAEANEEWGYIIEEVKKRHDNKDKSTNS